MKVLGDVLGLFWAGGFFSPPSHFQGATPMRQMGGYASVISSKGFIVSRHIPKYELCKIFCSDLSSVFHAGALNAARLLTEDPYEQVTPRPDLKDRRVNRQRRLRSFGKHPHPQYFRAYSQPIGARGRTKKPSCLSFVPWPTCPSRLNQLNFQTRQRKVIAAFPLLASL